MDIWQWTLTKDAIAPCFVRDVLDMRHPSPDPDFFWLGHTPCRTVLLVAIVLAVQVYDKRAIYTIDDGTAVIDCVLRHPAQTEPPPPLTEPGYPVRVVGRVMRHFHSKRIYADSIDLCTSSLDEVAHLERVIHLHKTKYSRPIPFVPPPKPRAPPVADPGVFSSPSHPAPPASYTLPEPPPMPIRNRPRPISTHLYAGHHRHPSSPAASIASSTPSSPCKPSSPAKLREVPSKPKLRHPSRIHSRDLTANTFRLYLKHYMDNAPPPFFVPSWSPSRSPCANITTPTKRARFGDGQSEGDEATPRPRPPPNAGGIESDDGHGSTLGFTLSHLRRVPELALLAARVVRAETRKRDKTRDSRRTSSTPAPSKSNTATDPPRKKMKRLFSWAVVKLYEEGSIVLWDGEVRPLPVPPPPGEGASGMWHVNTLASVDPSESTCGLASALYNLSASASLYSHYHAPRRKDGEDVASAFAFASAADADADPADLSDPSVDEEAYVPLSAQLLAGYVKEAVVALRRGRAGGATADEVLACMQRMDGRWARVGVWAVEEALAVLRAG